MDTELRTLALDIEKQIQSLPAQDLSFGVLDPTKTRDHKIHALLDEKTRALTTVNQARIKGEFLNFGPLFELIEDESITEIMLLAHDRICYEKNGSLHNYDDEFISKNTYKSFIDRICEEARCQWNIERPMTNGKYRDFRLHLISSEITQTEHSLSLRRHPKMPWTLEKLEAIDWCQPQEMKRVREVIATKKNFLVIGGTGSGKTSFLNACLQNLRPQERVVMIEDTPELTVPNRMSVKLITRQDPNGILPPIDQAELVRQSLRMRPDRLVMGEIRGSEAKDLLLALSTGHEGSFGTLHAYTAQQALIRLEMLIQLGAPAWSIDAIRQLIKLSLEYIFVVGRTESGARKLSGIYKLSSLEDMGLILEKV